jgi:hypothetical protein
MQAYWKQAFLGALQAEQAELDQRSDGLRT